MKKLFAFSLFIFSSGFIVAMELTKLSIEVLSSHKPAHEGLKKITEGALFNIGNQQTTSFDETAQKEQKISQFHERFLENVNNNAKKNNNIQGAYSLSVPQEKALKLEQGLRIYSRNRHDQAILSSIDCFLTKKKFNKKELALMQAIVDFGSKDKKEEEEESLDFKKIVDVIEEEKKNSEIKLFSLKRSLFTHGLTFFGGITTFWVLQKLGITPFN